MRRLLTSTCLAGLAWALAGCQEATQITVEISTDLECSALSATALSVGSIDDVDSKPFAATTASCNEGQVGSLVLVPADNGPPEVVVRVLAGVNVALEACETPTPGDPCIQAHRALGYVAQRSLVLPVPLRQACQGVVCDQGETCAQGVCVPAELPIELCAGADCNLEEQFLTCPCAGCSHACAGDVDGSGAVGTGDITQILSRFDNGCGDAFYTPRHDLDNNGDIDGIDLGIVQGFFGCDCGDLCGCERTPAPCPGDVNRDGEINGVDLELVSNNFSVLCGEAGYLPLADVNQDGSTDVDDIVATQQLFGSCP